MSFIEHESPQSGKMSAIKKKGNQQMTNAPVIIASVLAAFRSRFASNVSLRDFDFDGRPPLDGTFLLIGVDSI